MGSLYTRSVAVWEQMVQYDIMAKWEMGTDGAI